MNNIEELNDEQRAELAIATTDFILVLSQEFSSKELCALNLVIHLQGRVPEVNLAYEKAVKFKLIKEDGSLWDENALKMACAAEVNKRKDNGTL